MGWGGKEFEAESLIGEEKRRVWRREKRRKEINAKKEGFL
jgi:hypothetical protein